MTQDERAAMEWLEGFQHYAGTPGDAHARVIRAMLARPVMPEEAPEDAKAAMFEAYRAERNMGAIYRALRAHLSSPPAPTKTVNVFHVEYEWSVDFGQTWQLGIELYTSEEAARRFVCAPRRGAVQYRDARVTGPHARVVRT